MLSIGSKIAAMSVSVLAATMGGAATADVHGVDGSKLDLTQWEHRQQSYQPTAKRTCAKGDPKAVKVGGGTARPSVKVDNERNSLCQPKKPDNPRDPDDERRLDPHLAEPETHRPHGDSDSREPQPQC